MAAALASPPAPARSRKPICPPTLTTSIVWHPPSVEDTVDEGDGPELTIARDAQSPLTKAALATPATSVTSSFESDGQHEREDSPPPPPPPPHGPASASTAPLSRGPSYSSNMSAWPARRSSSYQRLSPRDDDASTRVIPEPRTNEGHGGYRQVGGSPVKSQSGGLQVPPPPPPPPSFHSAVPRITPATLSSIFTNTAPLNIGASTSPTATSPLCPSPGLYAADMPSPLSPFERPRVRFRDRGPPVIHVQARPGGPRPLSSEKQPSSSPGPVPDAVGVQQGWGVLFDAGYSTPRLGHVLRALAALVIGRFGSAGDVVVTPKAMRGMYAKYTLDGDEVWPYQDLFDQSSLSEIGELYRHMECRHHLVQDSPRRQPIIPGLTVDGWATWIAANMLAYPDQEWRRLSMMVAELSPLIIPDGPGGESLLLPTTLPRHCLPMSSDTKTGADLSKAIYHVLRDSEEAYIISQPSRGRRYTQPALSRPGSYAYPTDGRVSRHSVPRSGSGSRTTSMSRSFPFDSRVRTRSPAPDNRNASSTPNIGRPLSGSATTAHRESHRRIRRSDMPTYEDYFQAACRHSRDHESSPERPSRSRRHSDDRGVRRRRDKE